METVYGKQSSSCAFKCVEPFLQFDPSALVTVARSHDSRHRLRAPGVSGLLPLRALAPWIPAGRIGKGCFLKQNHSPLRKEVRRKLLVEEIDQAIVMAHHLQVPGPEFLELTEERMKVLEDKRRAHQDPKEK